MNKQYVEVVQNEKGLTSEGNTATWPSHFQAGFRDKASTVQRT